MTDVTTKNTATAPTSTPTTAPAAKAGSKPSDNSSKPKAKPKRRPRQRRRAAASDNESSGDEAGNRSDSSASSRSDAADSEDDDDVVETKKPSAFPDVSDITPAGWKKAATTEAISFQDFEAGKEPPSAPVGAGLSIKGRAKGKVEGSATGQKREYTEAETARYEAQKAKRKEKMKAKKAELKEKAQKDKEGKVKEVPKAAANGPATEKPVATPATKPAPAQPTKPKGKKRADSTPAASAPVAELTASTSALKLDDPAPATEKAETPQATVPEAAADINVESQRGVELLPNSAPSAEQPSTAARPPRGPRGNPREAHAQRMAEDPKLTPRVGQFWTHDQRLNEGGNAGDGPGGMRQMNPFWRGRAIPRGALRGGFRGRGGRGGFFPNGGRGGAVNGGPPRPAELAQEASKEEGSSKLAMDREFELAEAREKARSVPQAQPQAATQAEEVTTESEAHILVKPPTAPPAERKWGHEAFETMGNPEFRGARGRGRGMRARGGFISRVSHLPFHPSNLAAKAAAAQAKPPVENKAVPTPEVEQAVPENAPSPRETMSTQPTSDDLLDSGDDSFKVKFPGSEPAIVPAAPAPAAISEPPASEPAPVATAKEVSHEAQYPTLHSSSPGPVAAFQAQMYTGGSSNSPFPSSENGSAGSGHFRQQQGPGHFYAPGMNASGEFVPQSMQPHPHPQHSRPPFHPAQSRGHMPQAYGQFQPSSPYSPGPYDSHQAGPSYVGPGPMASPQGMFYPGPANGYANGRNSPLNPYMANGNGNQVGGYFSPARSASKVAIRAPRPGQEESNGSQQDSGPSNSTHDTNGHPQQHQPNGATYYPQHYNPYVQPFVPGHQQQQRQETVYYPTPNDQQYVGWQGQGYGDQGYYDANGSYGY